MQRIVVMFHGQPPRARLQVGLVRLLLLLALLPLLRLPLPVLHRHEDWPVGGAFSMSLPEHVHHFHQDIDETESHWHFVQLEDLGWVGMAIEAQLLNQQSISGIFEREYLPGFAFSHITQLLHFSWDCVLLPPNLWLNRTREILPSHGQFASSRTFLVQLLCQQQC
jgi:hypothetical protein